MLNWIREKFGKVVISGIIGSIALVFVFYGVFSPKSTRGLHEGSVAGTINGDAISISEFNRELSRRVEYFKKMLGGKITDEQLKNFRLREGVFRELANRRLLIQESQRLGIGASDEEVKDKIREMPVFQKDGSFDLDAYKQVLESNRLTPAGFERLMREDIAVQQWEGFFARRTHVSAEEVKQEFILNQEKRKLKYVVFTSETAKKQVSIDAAEVKKFLSDSAKMNLVKLRFEGGKDTLYQGQTLENAKESIARSILSGEKRDEIQKMNTEWANQVLALLGVGKSDDARVEKVLKPLGVKLQKTEWITRNAPRLVEVGEAKEFIDDAFSDKSPLDFQKGGKAKKYNFAGRILVGLVVDSQKADLTRLSEEKAVLTQQILARKARALFEAWMTQATSHAKYDMNQSVVGDHAEDSVGSSDSAPVPVDAD